LVRRPDAKGKALAKQQEELVECLVVVEVVSVVPAVASKMSQCNQ
jgi:hypothetical protein